MGKTPDYETLEEHMKRRHESISAKIADGLYSYARADWIKQRMPTFKKSAEGAWKPVFPADVLRAQLYSHVVDFFFMKKKNDWSGIETFVMECSFITDFSCNFK